MQGAILGNTNFDGSGNIVINTTQSNISMLTGSLTINASTSANKTIVFPAGYNKDNCVITSVGIVNSSNVAKGYNYVGTYNDSSDSLNNAYYRRINLIDEGIKLSVTNPNTNAITVSYKILLMKIS